MDRWPDDDPDFDPVFDPAGSDPVDPSLVDEAVWGQLAADPAAFLDAAPASQPKPDPTEPDVTAPAATPGGDGGRLDRIEAALADIEQALVRLDDGSYGRCEVCERPLDDEQLTAHPAVRHCRDHLPLVLD